jgi:transcription initiation factor IIE alpha subunit
MEHLFVCNNCEARITLEQLCSLNLPCTEELMVFCPDCGNDSFTIISITKEESCSCDNS